MLVAAAELNAVLTTRVADALAHAAGRGWRLDAAALEAGAAAAAITVGREGAFAALPTRDELVTIIALR